jgi:MFS family permease
LGSILRDPLVAPIIGVVFILLSGFGLVFPVLPLFAKSFGVGNDGAGLLIGTFGFARLFGDLIGGSIIDRKGERWTAIGGMAFLAVCSAATATAPNFALAVVLWGLAGIGSAVVFATLFSYIMKVSPSDRRGRILSFFYGAFNIGVIAGGAAGGFIANGFGLEAPLYAYSILLVVAIVGYLRFVPSPPSTSVEQEEINPTDEGAGCEAPRPSGGIVREFFHIPGFFTAVFTNLAYLWIIAAIFNTLLPLFGDQELNMSTAAIGGMFAVGVAAEFVVLFPAGSLTDRIGRKKVMIPSFLGLALSVAVIGLSTSALMVTVILAILAVFSGFAGVPPGAMLSDVVPAERTGRAIGAFRFFGDIGFFLGPLIAGAASKAFGFEWAFAMMAIIPLLAVVVTMRTKETLPAAQG